MINISNKQRKWLLSLHIIFSGILLGGTVVIVILSITALNTNSEEILKSCYTIMHILSETSVKASLIGTVVTGILLSLLTHWGLFRYYWIIVKQILTLLSIVVGIVGFYFWSLKGITIVSEIGLSAQSDPAYIANSVQLWIGMILQIISLTSMMIISIFKPWGQRRSKTVENK